MVQNKNSAQKVFRSRPDNMHPQNIDYNQIDSPLRPLIYAINKTKWVCSVGSCAGASYHSDQGGFYILLEVRGLKGIRNFIRWLSIAHQVGFNGYYRKKKLPGMACYEASIGTPNLLHGEKGTGALMGNDWFRFDLQLIPESVKDSPRENTFGAIMALSEAIKRVEGKFQ